MCDRMELKGKPGNRYAEFDEAPACRKCTKLIYSEEKARICDKCENIYCIECTHRHITGNLSSDNESKRYIFKVILNE